MNLVIFIIGVFAGALLYYVFSERKKTSGTIVIDLTGSAENPITMKFEESLNSIYLKKQVIFRVEVREDDSLN